jgi:type II secretion system protein G
MGHMPTTKQTMPGSGTLRAGFTLVEMLVVIVVLATLAAIVLPRFLNCGRRSREAALRTDLRILRNAITCFYNDTSWYPATLADLAAASAPATALNVGGHQKVLNAASWKGPYVERVPNDPVSWKPFAYYTDNTNPHRTGEVRSSAIGNGLDGTPYSAW